MVALIALTLGVSLAGSAQLRNSNGSLVTPNCADGQIAKVVGGAWACAEDASGGGSGLPAGAVVAILSGSCASTLGAGWNEASLGGKFLLATTNAAGDIGGTGGSDAITQVLNHTHTMASQTATTGSVSSWEHGAIDASSTAAETLPTGNPSGGVASIDNRPAFVKVIFCQKT